jgi:hypothetical protein
MGTERTRQLLLGAVALVLVVVVYRAWTATSVAPAPTSNGAGQTAGAPPRAGGPAAPPSGAALDVHLPALGADRPKPAGADRNLFRFKPKAPPPLPQVERPPPPVTNPVPAGPPPPPPVPPIPLKFIGTVERGGQKIAILSDSAGHVSYGPEGATIDGRYRIVKIGVESIELTHVDGRGQQLIRKTGS